MNRASPDLLGYLLAAAMGFFLARALAFAAAPVPADLVARVEALEQASKVPDRPLPPILPPAPDEYTPPWAGSPVRTERPRMVRPTPQYGALP